MTGEIDLLSAVTSAFAMLAALNYRLKTGKGQHIDVSSTESISVLIGEVLMDYASNGRIQTRKGNLDAYMAPHNCYRCKGENKWISIVVVTDEEWRIFCRVLGNPSWTEEQRFSSASSRWQNLEELDKLNPNKGEATDDMCTFLVINTSAITLIPATAIAIRASLGSANPQQIIIPSIIAATCATIVGLTTVKLIQAVNRKRAAKKNGEGK